MVIWVKHLTKRFFEGTVTKGWCFIQCFGSEFFSRIQIDFFPESGSGSAKTPDPVRKKRPKTGVKVEIFISTRFNTVLFGKGPPKPYQNYHLDPISLLMDGSGSAKKPGSIRIRSTGFILWEVPLGLTKGPQTELILLFPHSPSKRATEKKIHSVVLPIWRLVNWFARSWFSRDTVPLTRMRFLCTTAKHICQAMSRSGKFKNSTSLRW